MWTPYVCVFAASGVCSPDLWTTVFRWLRLKSLHPVVLVRLVPLTAPFVGRWFLTAVSCFQALILSAAVPTIIGFSLWREVRRSVPLGSDQNLQPGHGPVSPVLQFYPRVLAELAELQELDEPDTVELINWIR